MKVQNMKVVLNNGQCKLTIPKELAEEKGWGPGTKIRFVEDLEGNIFLKAVELKPVDKKAAASKKPKKKK
ncbi:AbrB/MazE/SpoVT family DNA-binding domain-containing protein [Candidatus Woesearchaeota archaeon]|nr:AbrB/MazE/SpoVT family DNA-binding domain-containing protein [Candidatus Woesearchaeota archaeon]